MHEKALQHSVTASSFMFGTRNISVGATTSRSEINVYLLTLRFLRELSWYFL